MLKFSSGYISKVFRQEIHSKKSESKAPKLKSRKRNFKGKCVSSIKKDDDSQTKDIIIKKK